MNNPLIDRYTYRVIWSDEDEEFVGPNGGISGVGQNDLGFEISGSRIVTTTLAGPYGTDVTVRADPDDCAIIIK